MSTFDGVVKEFPDIRIDYFRPSNSQSRPPLAYFLSHVHSDHLVGLESCKSPFIYCSPATRDILLRLEKYPHRMNFAKGILETRKQTYRHLKNLLKAIPLETTTSIELAPGKKIQVTLFNANHCVGAVMFLIEGDGKAILYTGDIRSEYRWLHNLAAHPLLVPYVPTIKGDQRLDCVYLDTTFVVTGREDPYRQFPSKAEGIKELLQKVAQYPKDTLFYFDAWTFGYEDVWLALSHFLGCRVHVDNYRHGLYIALANGREPKAPEAQKLVGFYCGNHFQQGCLSSSQSQVHSCEKGTGCEIWSKGFVSITPIVSRHNGDELAELGAGGGKGDLNQQHELEVWDAQLMGQLMALCASKLQGQPQLLTGVLQMLTSFIDEGRQSLALEDLASTTNLGMWESQEVALEELYDLPLEKLVPLLAKVVTKMKQKKVQTGNMNGARQLADHARRADGLPKQITFPYSRHSSYNELCYLIEAFKPKDIHPCTVDEKVWTMKSSMGFLFGHIYETPVSFWHDRMMLNKQGLGTSQNSTSKRPGSSSSTSSDYATPGGGHSYPMADQNHNGTEDDIEAISKEAHKNERQRRGRQAKGDYWPPVGVDHYSPSSGRPGRPNDVEYQVRIADGNGEPRPALNKIDATRTSSSPSRDRWRKRIADPSSPQREGGGRRSSKREKSRQSFEYGRLSPPPLSAGNEDGDGQEESTLESRPGGTRPLAMSKGTPAMPESTTSRMALRQEAYNAALGSTGYHWSNIGLASVNGHQMKEEEL